MTNPVRPTAALILISTLLAACGTTGTKDSILPTGLKPMGQIYKEHFERAPARHDMTLPKSHDTKLYGTLRVAASTLDHTFPRLANPTLVMTIYPHLAGPSGAPVPGYATYFTLYEQTEYAQPGEFIAPVHPADSETLEAEFAAGATP